jgi:hypothetical protein
MQDEEIDKIIQEAANQHHPPYDDGAWNKMEQLLDKHLPQQRDRKKPALLLLLLLLLGGGALFYTLVYPGINNKKGNTAIAEKKTTQQSNDQQKANDITADASTRVKDNAVTGNDDATAVVSPTDNTGNTTATIAATAQNSSGQTIAGNKGNKNTTPVTSVTKDKQDELTAASSPLSISKKARVKMRIRNGALSNDELSNSSADKNRSVVKNKKKKPAAKEVVNNGEENNEEQVAVAPVQTQVNKTNNDPVTAITTTDANNEAAKEKKKDADTTLLVKKDSDKKADTLATITASKNKEQKKKKGFSTNLGITISTGTDLSYVNIGHLGKATFLYGAGLSYPIGKRILVRTGFYVSKKIYSATPAEYNGVTYPYLNKIDGDCKVYEIPLSVNYNFGARNKHNWFGSLGLSSLLMKKEEYAYIYKVPGGTTYRYDQTINNENKHLFSVLNLSAGYQYNANKNLSFMAEPFVKLPLTGIGAGKIKLNSAGLLLTATIRPFAKKK